MSKPVDLTIRVTADTGEVAPGMQKLDKQLDEATKSAAKLDKELGDVSKHDVDIDVNTQAIKAARDRIDDLRDDIARMKAIDIDADTKKAEQDIAKLKKSIRALSEDAPKIELGGDDIGHSMKRGLGEASEGLSNFKEESNQTAKETFASFDGSAESIAGAFQEVAANALGGFGPAGMLAGLGIAAGIGVGIQALTKLSDAANKITDDAIALNDAFSDTTDTAGRVEVLQDRWSEFGNTINDVRSIWEVWQSRSTTNMEAFADSARLAGLDVEALNAAFTNPTPQARLKGLNDVLAQQKQALKDVRALQNQGHGEDVTEAEAKAWAEKRSAVEDTIKALEGEIEVSKVATELEKAAADVRGVSVDAYRAQIAASEEATAVREEEAASHKANAEAYAQMVADIADPVSVYEGLLDDANEAEKIRAQAVADGTADSSDSWEDYAGTVGVTTQQMIDEWNRQTENARQFETNLAIIGAAGGQALADSMRAKGPEVASAAAATVASSDPTTMQAAIDAYNAMVDAGNTVAGGYVSGISDKEQAVRDAWAKLLGLTPAVPAYSPYVNTGPPPPGWKPSGLSAPAAAAGANVRVYIDGNQLRASVRTDIAAASARAALVGAGARARP